MQLENNEKSLLESVMKQAATPRSAPPAVSKRNCPEALTWTRPGFGSKCRVMTSFGALPVEALRKRDPVKTASGRFIEVQWVDQIKLDARFLSLHPKANPVFIPKGVLNGTTPRADMLVSPAQQFRVAGLADTKSLSQAVSLTGRNRIMARAQTGFTYYLFHCGEPVLVSIDGLWCYTSP